MRRNIIKFIPFFLILLLSLFFFKVREDMKDFEVYWKAGNRIIRAEPLYRMEDGHYILKYIPSFALIVMPFGFLPLKVAKALWFFFSIISVIFFFLLSLELMPEKRLSTFLLIFISSLILLKFFARELDLGQVNIFMGITFLLGFSALQAKKDLLSGFFFSLSFVIKPYSAIILPYLFIKRKFFVFIISFIFMLFFLLLPSFIYGFKDNIQLINEWLNTIASSTSPLLILSNDNVSIIGMFYKWFGLGNLSLLLSIFTILFLISIFVFLLYLGKDLRSPDFFEISHLLIFIPLFSPQGWDYVFLLSLPAIMILINYFKEFNYYFRIVLAISFITIGFSIFDIMGRELYERFMKLSVITIAYFVIISSLVYLRIKKIA